MKNEILKSSFHFSSHKILCNYVSRIWHGREEFPLNGLFEGQKCNCNRYKLDGTWSSFKESIIVPNKCSKTFV